MFVCMVLNATFNNFKVISQRFLGTYLSYQYYWSMSPYTSESVEMLSPYSWVIEEEKLLYTSKSLVWLNLGSNPPPPAFEVEALLQHHCRSNQPKLQQVQWLYSRVKTWFSCKSTIPKVHTLQLLKISNSKSFNFMAISD